MSSVSPQQTDPFGDIVDEFVSAYRDGIAPTVEQFAAKYPEYSDELLDLLPTLVLMERAKDPDEAGPGQNEDEWTGLIGKQIGDYQIVREIGRGGMGIVYEAEQLSLGRQVAIKVLPKQAPLHSNQHLRFQRESKAAARLHHSNIVPVFGVGEADGLNYYVMQYIHGLGLDDVLDQLRLIREVDSDPSHEPSAWSQTSDSNRSQYSEHLARSLVSDERPIECSASPRTHDATTGRADDEISVGLLSKHDGQGKSSSPSFTAGQSSAQRRSQSSHSHSAKDPYWTNIARIGLQVSDALRYAHAQGITHRDIKPSNILLDIQRTAWVTDFGLAKSDDDANITRSGDILGTIRYMPPEAFEGQADTRGDIYSLGITLYELASLQPAFSGKDRRKLIKQVVTGGPEPLAKRVKTIPKDLATIIGKTIERDPNDRYQTAADLHEDLRRFVDDEPIRARRASALERLSRWSRQNRALAATSLGVVALLITMAVAGFATSIYFADQKEKQKTLYRQAQGMANSNAALAQKLEVALNSSLSSADDAERARRHAEQQSEVTRRHLYSANMLDAFATLQGHRGLSSTQALLDHWRPGGDEEDYRNWEWYYINSLCHQYSNALPKHRTAIRAIEKEPGGTRAASVSDDGQICVWDLQEATLLESFHSGMRATQCLSWDPLGRYLAVGGGRGFAVLDLKSREKIYRSSDDQTVHALSFSPNGKWLARLSHHRNPSTKTQDVALLETDSFQPVQSLPGIVQSLFGVRASWSSDGNRFAYPSDRVFVIWDVKREKRVFASRLKRGETIHSVQFHPTNPNRIASCGRDSTVLIWDLKERRVENVLRGHTHGISNLAWTPDGKRLATGSWDGSLRYWNTVTGKQLRMINGHHRHVFDLVWHEDRLWTGGFDRVLKSWDLDRNPGQRVITTLNHGTSMVSVHPQGHLVAAANAAGMVQVVDTENDDRVVTLPNQTSRIRDIQFSPDGTTLAVINRQGTLQLWDHASRTLVKSLTPDSNGPSGISSEMRFVSWAKDGSALATVNASGIIRLYNTGEQSFGPPIDSDLTQVQTMELSPDGSTIACGGTGGVRLIDSATGEQKASPDSLIWCSRVAWNHNGTQLAVATNRQTVLVWDVQTNESIAEVSDTFEPVYGIAWSNDDRRLCTVDARGNLVLWDPRIEQPTLKIQCGIGEVRSLDWSEDGARMVIGCGTNVTLLDATRGYAMERDSVSK